MKDVSVEVQTGSNIPWKKIGVATGAVAVVAAAGYGGYRYGRHAESKSLLDACKETKAADAAKTPA